MAAIVCTLCKQTFTTHPDYNEHEYGDQHRRNFEVKMNMIPVGHLLCKCCYAPVATLSGWEQHINGSKHKKCMAHLTNAGKNCVWDVPGVKLEDGSIKLCQSITTLQTIGWVDPPLRKKVSQRPLDPLSVIGMNCVTMRIGNAKGGVHIQKYHCQLCSVKFDQTSLSHISGSKHKINVIWNWDEVLADSLNRVAESDDKTKRDMFPVLLEQGVSKIFHLEQAALSPEQREVFNNITGLRGSERQDKAQESQDPTPEPHKELEPLKSKRNPIDNPWMTDTILEAVQIKEKLYKTWQKSRSEDDHTAYKIKRKSVTFAIKSAKDKLEAQMTAGMETTNDIELIIVNEEYDDFTDTTMITVPHKPISWQKNMFLVTFCVSLTVLELVFCFTEILNPSTNSNSTIKFNY